MIRPSTPDDTDTLYSIINDSAIAYKGVIPSDRWHEPYMPLGHLRNEIESGVRFYIYEEDNQALGCMGIQDVRDVTLIRHAYVKTDRRRHGIGGELLRHLLPLSSNPVLIGTWKAATWAIGFYEKHGFIRVSEEEKNRLLRKYWNIPERQVETSVVLIQTQPDSPSAVHPPEALIQISP